MASESTSRSWVWVLAVVLAAAAVGGYVWGGDEPVEPVSAPAAAERSPGRSSGGGGAFAASTQPDRYGDVASSSGPRSSGGSLLGAPPPARQHLGDGGVGESRAASTPAPRAQPQVIDVEPEASLEMAESIQHIAEVRLAQLREELIQARASGNRLRASRIERSIVELEGERPAMRRGVESLRRQVEQTDP